MAKKTSQQEEPIAPKPIHTGLHPVNIAEEMRTAYLDYAMSVITSRALPDARDGLKPVHRRILFAMNNMGLTPGAKFRKSATVVGEVLGNYHPHGDASVYDAMTKTAQDFSYRYPLVQGQGNFGCFTIDTKVRLADGRNLSFGELIEEDKQGKFNYTFTVTHNGKVAIAPIVKPRMTKKGAEIMKVILDNGESIKCTLNHKFLLKNQTYVEAKNLKSGDSLMPLYTRLSTKEDIPLSDMEGYEMVLHTLENKWEFVHHLADSYNIEKEIYNASKGNVRHHIDFNKLNNSPENIVRMKWLDHWYLHSELTAQRHKNDIEYVKKLEEGRKLFWSKDSNHEEYSKRLSERNIKNWENPVYREKMKVFLSKVNNDYIEAHPEKRKEISNRATETLKRLWQDPVYQKFMHNKIVKGNKNHITNKTGKSKFDTICKKVLTIGEKLSEDAYEQARLQVYPYGSATSWKTGISKYYNGDINRIQAEILGNHKVDRVEFLKEYEDVYDLTINSTHNFSLSAGVFVHNSIDGDGAAAMRYTEAKMSKVSMEMLRDIEKDTVLMVPNYDSSKKEPHVLPTAVPNLLLNGTLGIAVGMATNIPPHNLSELIDATTHLIDNPTATTEDLCEFVKGPDFPLGGIAFGQSDIRAAYATGRGGVTVRGEAEIYETKNGQFQIIITSIPFRVLKSNLIENIADLVREKKIEGIKGLRDESTKDIRVVIDLKSGTQPQKVLNYLYKHTELESVFHYNVVALVDGVPQTLALKSALESFIGHRKEVVRRRTEFDLRRALEKEHILLGLKKALDHIDEIIKTIRASKDTPDAHAQLVKKFKFSDIQATAILEMKLQRLAGLERKKIEDDLKAVQILIAELKAILASLKKMMGIIKDELAEIKAKYGDARRTKIVKHKAKEFNPEDLIADRDEVLVYTSGGYVKRTDPDEFRTQKRGGVGVVDMNTKEEDFVIMSLTTSTHSDLLFFTDKGKAYQIKMYDLPEGKRATRGKSIMNFLQLSDGEKVTSILPMEKEMKNTKNEDKVSLMMITKNGTVKKSSAESFKDVRRNGLIAIKLDNNDELLATLFVRDEDSVILTTQNGQSIRFSHTDVREMGRTATGVIGMKLDKGDVIVASDKIPGGTKGAELLIMTGNGYGKKTRLSEYKIQKRGGSGIKTVKVTEKTGKLMIARVVTGENQELLAVSKDSQVIRTELTSIPTLGRDTQGVRIMKLREGDTLASFNLL